MGISPPSTAALTRFLPEKKYKVFISGSNWDEDLKSEIDSYIRNLDEYLQREQDLNVTIRTWYSPRDTSPNYPTYMEDIKRELRTSDVFVGIAYRFFNPFTIMEWRIAFRMLTDNYYDFKFKDGAVFYFGNGEVTEIEDALGREELLKFVSELRQSTEDGELYWYPYKTFVTGEWRKHLNHHIEKVLRRDLYSPLQTWIIKDYGALKATAPTRGGPVHLGAE